MNRVAHFSNDNGVEIKYHMNHQFAELFGTRNEHEVMFRRISTYLINNGHVDGNIVDLGAWIGDNALPWAKSLMSQPKAATSGFDTKSLMSQPKAKNLMSPPSAATSGFDTKNLMSPPNTENLDSIHRVYAIDPSPDNCHFIKELAILNNIENITIIKKAISDKREVLYTNDNLTHCSFVNNDGYITNGKNSAIAWRLDDLLNAGEITNIAYIHLDVEGMENRVVAGAQKLIDTYKPIIAFEQHLEQDPFIELAEHLTQKGYIVYIINEFLPGCRPDCRNFIAFPITKFDDKIAEVINAHLGQDVLECLML